MKLTGSNAWLPSLAALTALVACSDSLSKVDGGGAMYIDTCSLGCNRGIDADGSILDVTCQVTAISRNQEVAVVFSSAVDMAKVTSQSFRVIDTATGGVPTGTFVRDPANDHRLIYRPSLTFDSLGNPIYGFDPDTTYQVRIKGEQGTGQMALGPFIESIGGRANQSALDCSVRTDTSIVDQVPGAPVFSAVVDTVDPNSGAIIPGQDADGAVDVSQNTSIDFTFQDVMNPATLANPSTGLAPYITIQVDPDGDLGTSSDRVDVFGTFDIDIDLELLVTRLSFTSFQPLPSSGSDPANPRLVVVNLPSGVLDLAGNSLDDFDSDGAPGGIFSFAVEVVPFGAFELVDEFNSATPGENDFGQDSSRSCVGMLSVDNTLVRGVGGGSGRLGELILSPGENVVLVTDNSSGAGSTFPLPNHPADILGNDDATIIEIIDGVFEFSSVHVPNGASITFQGGNPARLFSRGPITVDEGGVIDVSGGNAPTHDGVLMHSQQASSFVGEGGPFAGAGGVGGDRYDTQDLSLQIAGGTGNPGAITAGQAGEGVGQFANLGGGRGGAKYPDNYPTGIATQIQLGDLTFSTGCASDQVGGTGSGGAYAVDGQPGIASAETTVSSSPAGVENAGPDTAGGDPTGVFDASGLARTLTPDEGPGGANFPHGFLRGGSGGGGGGNHPMNSHSNSTGGDSDCWDSNMYTIDEWYDHSGASGGGGGGVIQVTSGTRITLSGEVKSVGGQGGTAITGGFSSPGGGGSGGGVLLQAVDILVLNQPMRINVEGGEGGASNWVNQDTGLPSMGGQGSPGIVRIEDFFGFVDDATLAPSIAPFDPLDPTSPDILSVGAGAYDQPATFRDGYLPNAFTGSVSCWKVPPGNFFEMSFDADGDDPASGDPTLMGWNADITFATNPTQPNNTVTVSYRGFDPLGDNPFGESLESHYGDTMNHDFDGDGNLDGTAPITFRFQGARTFMALDNPCDVDLIGPASPINQGSLTPWVSHPAELNNYDPKPSMVRFTVIYDATQLSMHSVLAVDNLIIRGALD